MLYWSKVEEFSWMTTNLISRLYFFRSKYNCVYNLNSNLSFKCLFVWALTREKLRCSCWDILTAFWHLLTAFWQHFDSILAPFDSSHAQGRKNSQQTEKCLSCSCGWRFSWKPLIFYNLLFQVPVVAANITDDRAKWIFRDDTQRTRLHLYLNKTIFDNIW